MADIRRELQPQHHRSGMLSDILFALFRRKWIIVLCTLLGIAAAAAFFVLFPPAYQSQAKLLVRYVLERSGVDPIDNTTKPTQAGQDDRLRHRFRSADSDELGFGRPSRRSHRCETAWCIFERSRCGQHSLRVAGRSIQRKRRHSRILHKPPTRSSRHLFCRSC